MSVHWENDKEVVELENKWLPGNVNDRGHGPYDKGVHGCPNERGKERQRRVYSETVTLERTSMKYFVVLGRGCQVYGMLCE